MRFEIGLAPNTMHQILADAEMLGEFATGPVGGAVGGWTTSRVENLGAKTSCQLDGRLSGLVGFESIETRCEEALFP